MNNLKLNIFFHQDFLTVEIPSNLMELNKKDFWPSIQKKIANHFIECSDQGIISPVISGLNPGPGSLVLFESLWNKELGKISE
jgi:hypothetical protein